MEVGNMKKENVNLYSQDYYEALKVVNKWPNWKKEYANDCILISKYAKKIPLYVDDDSLNKKDTMLQLKSFK